MNASSDATPVAARLFRSRLRFELIFASAWLGFGLLVLPAVIYAVGVAALGPYGKNQGLGMFYADFFRDLAEPSARGWTVALGPWVIILLLRAVFLGVHAETSPADDASHQSPSRTPAEQSRVEPRISLD